MRRTLNLLGLTHVPGSKVGESVACLTSTPVLHVQPHTHILAGCEGRQCQGQGGPRPEQAHPIQGQGSPLLYY